MAEPTISNAERVRTSTMDWNAQCLMAEAADRLDTPQEGLAAALSLRDRPVVYEFSNGRRFVDRTNPYV